MVSLQMDHPQALEDGYGGCINQQIVQYSEPFLLSFSYTESEEIRLVMNAIT